MERLRAIVSWIATGAIAVGMALVVVLSNHGATAPASKVTVETVAPTTSITASKGRPTVTHHVAPKLGSTFRPRHSAAPPGPVNQPPTTPAVHSVTTTTVAPTTTTTFVPVTSSTSPQRDGEDSGSPGADT